MRCVLGLFEGVVTGAADGYYRMTGNPAATLLHLGPGLGNGLANLHNAKKARSGIVNIVGEHAALSHQARCAAHVRHRGRRSPDVRLGAHIAAGPDTLAADARLRSSRRARRRAASRR